MKAVVERLQQLLETGKKSISNQPESDLLHKPSPIKWSKKEILGHLVDSAVNNLQRFTEIQFESKPYPIRRYNQDELVKANGYQEAEVNDILSLWLALNQRIIEVMKVQSDKTLAYPIILPNGASADLKFLMTDYVDHMEHHLNQIKG